MGNKLFLDNLKSTDEIYLLVRDSPRDELVNARKYMTELWSVYQEFSDKDYPIQLAQDFHARFWEMYLTCVLINLGKKVYPKETISEGPDIAVKDDSRIIFVEAITPSEGDITNPDKVPGFKFGEATQVPDNQITLRYCGAIADKFMKYKTYLEKGIVSPSDPYIIALNACKIEQAIADGSSEYDIPRIVKSVFPVGNKVAYINKATGSEVPWSYQPRNKVYRSSGSPIQTDLFLNPDYQGLSGIIFSRKDLFNLPGHRGDELIFVRNPLAKNPIPHEFFKFGVEFVITLATDHFSIDRNFWNKH